MNHNHHTIAKSFKAKANTRRTTAEKFADVMTSKFGSMAFLLVNLLLFTAWIILNVNIIPELQPFDPYPFGLLTMIVSLQAIVLSIVVLISQNRAAAIADVREEIDLRMDVITEQELTKLMKMVAQLLEKQGINIHNDHELQKMLKPINVQRITQSLEKEIDGTE